MWRKQSEEESVSRTDSLLLWVEINLFECNDCFVFQTGGDIELKAGRWLMEVVMKVEVTAAEVEGKTEDLKC